MRPGPTAGNGWAGETITRVLGDGTHMDLTLFEVHLDEASFDATAPFADESSDEGSTGIDVAEGGSESEEGGRSPVPFVVGLVFLVGVGLAIRRFMGGSDEPGEEMDEATAEPITA